VQESRDKREIGMLKNEVKINREELKRLQLQTQGIDTDFKI
jgi:hypothetical protein